MPPGEGIIVELVEETDLSGGDATEGRPQRFRSIVNCGKPARDMIVEIRDEDGAKLNERKIGKVWTTGPLMTVGYLRARKRGVVGKRGEVRGGGEWRGSNKRKEKTQ